MLEKIKEMLNPHKLVYLTEFGSTLYGMNSPESDIDYKGIFVPNKEDLLLGKKMKSLNFSTGNDKSKNSKEDIDVEVWSLHYFLELLKKGETGAVDLLFSMNSNSVIFNELKTSLYDNRHRLFNPKDTNAFVGYAIGQAKKYGLKGTRMGVYKDIMGLFEQMNDNVKLLGYLSYIDCMCHDNSYCFIKTTNDIKSLVLCGKVHQGTITVREFKERVLRDWDRYGERARLAMEGNGIDKKAISHAIRCLYQMNELVTTGNIVFPLKDREFLKEIKYGNHNWDYLNKVICDELEVTKQNVENCSLDFKCNKLFKEKIILEYY